MSQNSET